MMEGNMNNNTRRQPATSSTTSARTTHNASPKTHAKCILQPDDIIGGNYRIVKTLGRGGMGEVYLARHVQLDIYRAVKILLPSVAKSDPVFATRFMQEAKLAIVLQHPNIVNVMDAGKDEKYGVYYIVMELVDGGNVRNMLKKNGAFREAEALDIVYEVGKALAAAEKQKFVHRDIKPDNIMMTKDNQVKVADLGIAKSATQNCNADVTMPQVLIGTPAYVSPEQAKDAKHVDSRADIYSLGVTLYEMLTGEKPYQGGSTVEILEKIFNDPVPDVRDKAPQVSRKTAELVRSMMAKFPEDRPKSWAVFCEKVAGLTDRTRRMSLSDTVTTAITDNFTNAITRFGKGIFMNWEEVEARGKLKKLVKFMLVCIVILVLLLIAVPLVRVYHTELARAGEAVKTVLLTAEQKTDCRKYGIMPTFWEVLTLRSEESWAFWVMKNKPEPAVFRVKCRDVQGVRISIDDETWEKGEEYVLDPVDETCEYTFYVKAPGFKMAQKEHVRLKRGETFVWDDCVLEKEAVSTVKLDCGGAKNVEVSLDGGKTWERTDKVITPLSQCVFHVRAENCRPRMISLSLLPGEERVEKVLLQEMVQEATPVVLDCGGVAGVEYSLDEGKSWEKGTEFRSVNARNVVWVRAPGYRVLQTVVLITPGVRHTEKLELEKDTGSTVAVTVDCGEVKDFEVSTDGQVWTKSKTFVYDSEKRPVCSFFVRSADCRLRFTAVHPEGKTAVLKVALMSSGKTSGKTADELFREAEKLYSGEGKRTGATDEDRLNAQKYFLEAAECGSADAVCRMGQLYENGWLVEQVQGDGRIRIVRESADVQTALLWYRYGAAAGHLGSIVKAADIYSTGRPGLKRDIGQAEYFYGLGAKLKDPQCQYELGEIYFSRREWERASRTFLEVVRNGKADMRLKEQARRRLNDAQSEL